MKLVAVVGMSVVLLFCLACGAPSSPPRPTRGPTATEVPTRGTVTDVSVPLEASENGALVDRGFDGTGDFGRLAQGCTVEVLKITDRAAQVKVLGCATSDAFTPPTGVQGWVAKSALSLR